MSSKTVKLIGRLKSDRRAEEIITEIEYDFRHSVDVISDNMIIALGEFTTLPGNWIRLDHAIYDLSDYDRVRFEIEEAG